MADQFEWIRDLKKGMEKAKKEKKVILLDFFNPG